MVCYARAWVFSWIVLAAAHAAAAAPGDSPADYALPDPLTTLSGKPIASAAEWEANRRPELLALFAQHQYGVTPSKPVATSVEVFESDAPGLEGAARRRQVRIHLGDGDDHPVIRVLRYTPAGAKEPAPTLLHIGFAPNVAAAGEPGIDEGMAWNTRERRRVPDREAFSFGPFNVRHFIDRGYGVALVYYGDIEPDFDHGGRHGVRSLFGADGGPREADEWGSIGAWSWGLSRVLDYLQTDPAVDGQRVALAGFSRLGKTVCWAAAQDERFALAIPMASGEGGAAISRRDSGETIADLTKPTRYHYWFAPRYADYAQDVAALPVDSHLLVSLMAPRPVLLLTGAEDAWSDPVGEWVAAKAAAPVYQLYGLSGPAPERYPSSETYAPGDLAYFVHDGGHTLLPQDLEIMTRFMDEHLRENRDAPE